MPFLKRCWPLLLVVAPLSALIAGMARFFVDVPFADSWGMVPYLQKSLDGTLTFRDLLEQHNESRIFFPRLLMLGLARISGWNGAFEIPAIALMAGATLFLLSWQAIRGGGDAPGNSRRWLPFLFSLLVFSPLQYECWTFGFTIVGYMNVLFVAASLVLLASPRLSAGVLAGAVLSGIAATYSYANGVIVWPAGLMLILMRERDAHRNERGQSEPFAGRAGFCAIWTIFAALASLSYFHGYVKPGLHPPMLFFLEYPGIFAQYLLAFIGAALVNVPALPVWAPAAAGAAGLLVFLAGAAAWLFSPERKYSSFPFWIALGCYSLMTGLSAALGRSAYGAAHALESRYTMFSGLFWMSALTMAAGMAREGNLVLAGRRNRFPLFLLNGAAVMASAACLACFLLSSYSALGKWRQRHDFMADIRNELLTGRPDYATLERSFPSVPLMLKYSAWLSGQRLSLFRHEPSFETLHPVRADDRPVRVLECDLAPNTSFDDGSFLLSGTLDGLPPGSRLKAVLLADSNGTVVARSGLPNRSATWRLRVKAKKLPSGVSLLDVFALFRHGTTAARVGQVQLIVVQSSDIRDVFRTDSFVERPDETWGYLDTAHYAGGSLHVVGWARNPAAREPARWVGVADSETNFLAFARVGEERRDVAACFRDRNLLRSGWRAVLAGEAIAPGRHTLGAYVLLPEEHKAVRLRNEFELIAP